MATTTRARDARRTVRATVAAGICALLLPMSATPAAATTCLPGTGTTADPFLVASASDLALVGSGTGGCSAGSHYLQTADVTLTGTWTPISSFSGSYDGGGHTIRGLSVNVGTSGGLFADTTTGALLRRIRIVDGSVTGSSNTGGLVGRATATRIEDAHYSGSVTSTSGSVGGLVGYTITDSATDQPTTILRSSTSGTVTAQGNNVGGLVGYLADGGVRSSFSTADVTGVGDLHGGLVGYATSLSPSATPLPLVVTGSTTATTSSGAGSIVAGDTFDWSVVLDLNSASTGVDEFYNALKAVTLTASPTNTGTWSPDAIVWDLGPAKNVLVYDNVRDTQLVLQIEADSGAPAIDGVAFGDLDLTLFWEVADLNGVTGQADLRRFFGTTRPPLETAEGAGRCRSCSQGRRRSSSTGRCRTGSRGT